MSDRSDLEQVQQCGRRIRNCHAPRLELQLAAIRQNRSAYWHIAPNERHPEATQLFEQRTAERAASLAMQKRHKISRHVMGYDMARTAVGAPHKIFRQHVLRRAAVST